MSHTMINKGLLDSKLNNSGLKGTLKKDISNDKTFQLGLDLNQYHADLIAQENNFSYVSETQKELEATLFGDYQFWLSHKFLFVLGSRITHLTQPSEIYVLPNARVSYFLGEHVNFRAAFSQSVQAMHELTIVNRFGREMEALVLNDAEAGFPVLRSDKYMIGTVIRPLIFPLMPSFIIKTWMA
jgi:hypothetical protein